MARISTYGIDAKPDLLDKVIGTDTRSGFLTKNYTLGEIADLINQTNSLGVADQSIFLFQSDLSEGRDAGTISFAAGGGDGTAFSSINTILLSKSGAGDKNISNFLPLFVGKKIIIARIDDINNFGTYKVASMTDYIPDTSFLEVSLTVVEYNGSIEAEEYYAFSEFSEPSSLSSDKNFVFTQSAASSTWSVQHNLNKFPSCTMVLSTGQQGYGDVTFIDENNLTITFAGAESGKAYIN